MRTLRTLMMTAAIALPMLGAPALAAEPSGSYIGPVGMWLTESGHGVIRIAPCAGGLCGTIVGIDRAPNEPMPTDFQGRPQCGLTILSGGSVKQDGVVDGHITDPRDGKTYQAEFWMDDAGQLHLRGYVGVPLLGATQIWRPFSGQIADDCRIV